MATLIILRAVVVMGVMQILCRASGAVNTSIPCKPVRTADGGCCVFPFVHKTRRFYGCTAEDTPFNLYYWCGQTANYDRDQTFGYCILSCATVPTDKGACCVFPFEHNRKTYTGCTTDDHDRAWCAVSSEIYDKTYYWGNCLDGLTIKTLKKPTTSVSRRGCLAGWYNIAKFCYRFVPFLGKGHSKGLKTLQIARKACFESGADLAAPHNQSILKSLRSVYEGHQSWNIPEAYLRPLLLGAYSGFQEEWKWSDGSRVNPAVWGLGEPKLTRGGKCGVLADSSKNFSSSHTSCGWWLKVAFCDQLRGFICEKLPVNRTCKTGYVFIEGLCYKIYYQARLNWTEARLSRDHGDLATVNTTAEREGLSDLLETISLDFAPETLYLGLSIDTWAWLDGSAIDSSLWESDYPREDDRSKTCVVLDGYKWKIKNVPCIKQSITGFICQSREVNAGFSATTSASSVDQSYKSSFAVDSNLTTCFYSTKELDPWIRIKLGRDFLIYKIQLTSRNDIIETSFLTYVISYDDVTDSIVTCNKNKKRTGLVFHCVPPVNAITVEVKLKGNASLVICDAYIYGMESKSDAYGVLREVWYMNENTDEDFEDMDEVIVDSWHVIQTPSAPVNFSMNYLQKLTTYFKVFEGGNHSFYMTCKQKCELRAQKVSDLVRHTEPTTTKLLQLVKPTFDWNRSKVLRLSECYLYKLEVFMVNKEAEDDHLSVGVQLPNGEIQKPVSGQHLYWIKPGERTFEIDLNKSDPREILIADVGDTFTVTGSYKYCCHGVFCPDCNLNLSLLILNQSLLLNHSLSMTCQEILFRVNTEVDIHPGEYDIQVST